MKPLALKAEIQGHRMVADASTKRALRSYSASRHYNDYYVAGSNGNVDGRQGVRLGSRPSDVDLFF